MTPSFELPPGYSRVAVVGSFEELVSTRFDKGVNALCWPRALAGDFGEIASHFMEDDGTGLTSLDEACLGALSLSPEGIIARDILIQDLRLLRSRDLDPTLNCIQGYPRDDEACPVRTDVYSFHVDQAPIETDTYLCSYYGPCSEGLRNDQAIRRVDLPETRAALLELYGGADDDDFLDFLKDEHYDLHYAPLADASPFAFGAGHLWRIACEYPGSPVPPCIHRAPDTRAGDPPRLLLIS